ncbi:phage tail terminator protein [Gracilibacillus thailandensis]|uniref:Minor capsid protein n=1 Tax=Gracilibacillus thailandensis TaxID=563735 RepID=A0A6N7QVI7_9BACI|nr:minor capsid protein [Gracilibacillus thailandensis]MRI65162.1 hypothetical protein [Gracilibacillus thailandensis]
MDFLQRLKEYTEQLSFTPSIIQIGTYQSDRNSVAIRPAPSNPDTKYFNKGMVYPFSFQILVHHKDNLIAYQMIEDLRSAYENLNSGAITSSDGSFSMILMECTTTPNYVQPTNYGNLYTALFQAELLI